MAMTHASFHYLAKQWKDRASIAIKKDLAGHVCFAENMFAIWEGYAERAKKMFDQCVGDDGITYYSVEPPPESISL